MFYYTNEARKRARETIHCLMIKLANLPLNIENGFNYDDVGNLQHYLESLDKAIYKEMKDKPWE